jgi:polysaccharide biosynthesis transport protein
MLQKRPSPDAMTESAYGRAAEPVALDALLPLMKRYALLFIAIVATFVIAAAAYVVIAVPSYVATTQLLIESQKGQPFMLEPGMMDLTIDNAHVESQVEILRSERISTQVIRQLGLTADPEFRGEIDPGTEAARIRPTISNFGERLSVRRVGQSYVLEISFRSRVAAKSATIANAVVAAYLQDQIDARAQTARQGTEWLQARIDELSVQLRDSARAVQDFRTARDGNASTGRMSVIDAETRLAELDSRVQSYRKLQDSMLQKLTETAQKQSLAVTNARVITPATTPLGKSSPKTTLILAMALLSGCLVGTGAAMLAHASDRGIREASALRRIASPDLTAELPRFGVSGGHFRRSVAGQPVALPRLESMGQAFVDALNRAKVSIDIAGLTKPVYSIGITSVEGDSGSTTIAVSLATIYAASGARTLLIDGNLRNPALSRALSPPPDRRAPSLRVEPTAIRESGLLKALKAEHQSKLAEADLVAVPNTSVMLLPAVFEGGPPVLASGLDGRRMKNLLDTLKQTYSIVIIDLPALDEVADALAVAGAVDLMVIVASYGQTRTADVAETVDALETAQAGMVGVFINRTEQR